MLAFHKLDPQKYISKKVLLQIQIFTLKKIYLNLSSMKFRPFCPGHNGLKWQMLHNPGYQTLQEWIRCQGIATITRYLSSHIWCCHYLPPGSLLTLGHPNPFHIATSLLIWYKMFCMRDISYRLIWMKFISMLSVYANSGTHRRFDWWMIASFTQNPSVLMCVEITDAPKL